jgi:hypothetical protein
MNFASFSCLLCPTGTFRPVSSDDFDCFICPKGSFCNSTGMQGPIACPPGTVLVYNGATSSSNCTLCPAGHYCSNPATDPTPCGQHTQSQVTGATTSSVCTSCAAGQYCAPFNMFPAPPPNSTTGRVEFQDSGVNQFYRVFEADYMTRGFDVVYRYEIGSLVCHWHGFTHI